MNNTQIINALASLINKESTKNNLDIQIAFKHFIEHAKTKCRPDTIKYYHNKFKVLHSSLDILGYSDLKDIDKIVYNRLINLFKSQGYSNSTINKLCDLLKSIFKVNFELDYINYNPLANIQKLKVVNPKIKIIDNRVKATIYKFLLTLEQSPSNLRNITAIMLLNDTGMRINELINIKVKNIDIDKNYIFLDFTKTIKSRYVYFDNDTKSFLMKWLDFHNNKSEYLFITLNGTKLKRRTIYEFLDLIKSKTGIEQSISPHKWRHTLATNLINENVNLNEVMEILGHTEFETTKRYLHQENEHIKNNILSVLDKNKKSTL